MRIKEEIAEILVRAIKDKDSYGKNNGKIDWSNNGKLAVILMSARSGSTYLQSMFNSIHREDVIAAEFLAPDLLAILKEKYQWGIAELIDSIKEIISSGKKVIWKLNYFHYINALSLEPEVQEILQKQTYIYRLKRKDLTAQILSRYYARTSGLWGIYGDNTRLDYKSKTKEPTNNINHEIADATNFILSSEIGWDRYIGESKIKIIEEIFYEDLIENPLYYMNAIEKKLNLKESKSNDLNRERGEITQKLGKKDESDHDRKLILKNAELLRRKLELMEQG